SVSEVIQRTPDIKTFRFDVGGRKDIEYQSGQFFFVTIRIDSREAVHHFTISSAPTETEKNGYLEFTKRITASDFSQALDRMKAGDWVRLRGAEGDFVLPAQNGKLAFLSGGIGITPLRSMLRYMADKKLDYDVVLIYGNNTWENIAFREELEEIASTRKSIRIEYVLSGPDFPPGWEGKKGFITKELITELMPDYQERTFYLSGPLRMVIALEEQISAIDVPQEQVKRDYFPGYD
ncbi:MAG: FAD-dependent oxidoreductase, partial [Dehalococcoidales bacterium]|nr:FAD-dependent oxidoreductase [Dehalococcoidales bacterium]